MEIVDDVSLQKSSNPPNGNLKVATIVVRWLIIGIVLSVSLVFVVWQILYSVRLANISFVIPLRLQYQKLVWKISSPIVPDGSTPTLHKPIYTIVVSKSNSGDKPSSEISTFYWGRYSYLFFGKFQKLSGQDNHIELIGLDSKIYSFNTNMGTFVILDLDNQQEVSIDLFKEAVHANEPILVRWSENRTLYQIFSDYSKNSMSVLNNSSPTSFVVINNSSSLIEGGR